MATRAIPFNAARLASSHVRISTTGPNLGVQPKGHDSDHRVAGRR